MFCISFSVVINQDGKHLFMIFNINALRGRDKHLVMKWIQGVYKVNSNINVNMI